MDAAARKTFLTSLAAKMAPFDTARGEDEEEMKYAFVDLLSFDPGMDKDRPLKEDRVSAVESEHEDGLVTDVQDKDEIASSMSEIESPEVGNKVEIKTLYASPNSYCSCCRTWDDNMPSDAYGHEDKERIEKERAQFAILKRLDRHGRDVWKTHSIEINSKHIRDRLTQVFVDYPDVDLHAVKLSFSPPFLPFIHRWQAFTDVCETETIAAAKAHLTLLKDYLQPEIDEAFQTLQKIEETGYASFENLSLIYRTGDIVINSSHHSDRSAGILRDVTLRKSEGFMAYDFEVDMVDWNGEKFGVCKESWLQVMYKGSKQLSELTVLPFTKDKDPQALRDSLIKRGRKFESLRGQHLSRYAGTAITMGDKSLTSGVPEMPRRIPMSERVLIDATTCSSLRGELPRALRPLTDLQGSVKPEAAANAHDVYDLYPPPFPVPGQLDPTAHSKYDPDDIAAIGSMAREMHTNTQGEIHEILDIKSLTDDECFFTVPWVTGFAMQTKKWCTLNVVSVHEIVWNTSALDHLVLGDSEKKLLSALVAPKDSQDDNEFDDFIEGKGRGVVVLLCGPPGVGKTLTAESLAEHLRRPLYRLGASDLGSTVAVIEERLTEILLRCAAWDAMLLIDEADVFLEARTTDSLERNELVSSFLRLLEYYTGILILTTNRVSSIDTAFESRIDITLSYADLSEAGRAKIWSSFLKSLPSKDVDTSEEDIAALAKEQLNGRQIKSVVKTARILARSEGKALNKDHLEVVVRLREKAKQLVGQGNEVSQ